MLSNRTESGGKRGSKQTKTETFSVLQKSTETFMHTNHNLPFKR